ncbi:pyridoxamine 5'-phosphate oxidase family protein [Peribacillus cavernae]|uniref:Pyridoxamine 5'-phosphate oxidase family protein n=1 Tax=Peribacillus cavernae TaxID=1674310 RepID=A0A3S1B9D6_9BACI|nr:MSMEG_1061 family FMN-dependent PPOX-type flavoprotein [Peribacillus cavernae]MDQ0220678.1 PPOX class probable FMN-dependent enzyme [Peribacillus cavernae]RUQ31130.1 pyridoxamine 5'-phosphate oxidase family protein [Peribacillus cavernae]
MQFENEVNSVDELRSLLGLPGALAENKVIDYLDEDCVDFLSKSPFLILSSANSAGRCDSSPRGDAPGFIHIIDQNHLVIPERPGNRRLDSIRNIMENRQIGLLFLIPGLDETLRINGAATIIRDEKILAKMQANGKTPLIGIAVQVEECFIHCGKAFKRSALWNEDAWLENASLPSAAKMLAAHAKLPHMNEQVVATSLEDTYTKRLY